MASYPYWGIHTSLYRSLPVESIRSIERAIWLKMTGRANDARAVFDHELKSSTKFPVVTIEYADLELEAGRWGRAWRMLDSALANATEANDDLDAPEYRLMALTRAMLGTRHRGDLVSSVQEIKRSHSWLLNVPVAEYTDIQTSCVRRYVITYLFTRVYTAYQDPEMEHIPSIKGSDLSRDREPWEGLHQLRRSLCDRQMFNEASSLFPVELSRISPGFREPVFDEFLLSITGLGTDRGRDYIEGSVRLQQAKTYLLQNPHRAVEEFAKSESAFNRFCDHFNLVNRTLIPQFQILEYEKLGCIQNPVERLRRTEELATALEQAGSPKTDVCLSDAAELTIAFYEATSDQEYRDKYYDLVSRLEKYDETVSEDLTSLVTHHIDLIYGTLHSSVDQQKSLEWIEGFVQRYPYFSAPTVLSTLYKSQSELLRALHRIEEADRAEKKANELEGDYIMNLNLMYLGGGPTTATPLNKSSSSPNIDSEDEDGELLPWAWRRADTDQVKKKEMAVKFLWEWSLNDIATGDLAIKDFQMMMNIPDTQIPDIFNTKREADLENTTDIASVIFIQGSDLDVSQEARYDRICRWLSDAPKGHRKRRLFCLAMLRSAREVHFAENKMWDRRVTELQHLLELQHSLPMSVREYLPYSEGTWMGALAITYAKLFRAQSLEKVLEAEAWNELALIEFRRKSKRVQIALHQRLGANLCIMKICKLRQSLRQVKTATAAGSVCTDAVNNLPCAEEIRRLRAVGLEKITEADKLLTETAIHASWSDGFDGITHRQDATAFYKNGHTVHTAVSLLLAEEGELSQETRSSVWSWVQKFKARSLARTIGIRAYDPPELVRKIMDDPEARPLYEEMLSLWRQIEEAENLNPLARYELRRQLDAHIGTMKKKHGLLHQLIGLREAAPFNISEMAGIEATAGTSIVLVDWFYLPPYMDGETGRLLLLTARPGAEPTMDFLTTKIEHITAWKNDYLYPPKWNSVQEENLIPMEAREVFDRMLGGLAAPLAYHTNPNEVLVFCPSDILHGVPLHALSLQIHPSDDEDCFKEPLIHRNPVVYTHSHTLLRSCFASTEFARGSPVSMKPCFVSGISQAKTGGNNDESMPQPDYSKGRSSIQELARRFDTTPMIDDSASKEQFLKAAAGSRLLHLQTHGNWKSGDPLDHHVEFPLADRDAGEQRAESSDRQVGRLTARELFDIHFPPGTHVNMIACQGGVTDVRLGDEVMGLVPALLYSGASSTVSTLWRIDDGDGAQFSKYFFNSFLQQCARQKGEGGSAGFVNLARAVRAAVKKMDESQIEPLYRWAGFVLHGFWQFPVSAEDMTWIQARRR